jgi:hypothetical protein
MLNHDSMFMDTLHALFVHGGSWKSKNNIQNILRLLAVECRKIASWKEAAPSESESASDDGDHEDMGIVQSKVEVDGMAQSHEFDRQTLRLAQFSHGDQSKRVIKCEIHHSLPLGCFSNHEAKDNRKLDRKYFLETMQQHWEHSAQPEALKGLHSHALTQFERQHRLGDLSNMPPTHGPDFVRRIPLRPYQDFWGETKFATEMARDEEAKPAKRSVRAIDQLCQICYRTSFVI